MNPIRGIIAVVSNYGVGKTTFSLECGYHPNNITFINDDVKETGFDDQFKVYVDLVSERRKPLELHDHCLNLIKNLPESEVIIWDTWTHFQSSFPIFVKANMNLFRNPKDWSANGKIKSGEIYQESYRYEGSVLSELKKKCKLLILTFHLKQDYLNNVAIPGKFKPGHDKAIEKFADLRIWLTPNADSQVPRGLVLKNISKREIVENQGIRTSQILPLRIPSCNWTSIIEYWHNPIGNRNLIDEERPNEFELSLIEGILTPEDKRLYEASLSLVEKQESQERAELLMRKNEQENQIKVFIKDELNGLPMPAKVSKVKEYINDKEIEYNGEITIAKIIDWS